MMAVDELREEIPVKKKEDFPPHRFNGVEARRRAVDDESGACVAAQRLLQHARQLGVWEQHGEPQRANRTQTNSREHWETEYNRLNLKHT